tara:strand:+ start:322 stop:591 length:270 start_codon:yes stop_codon:yes gene_type:complete
MSEIKLTVKEKVEKKMALKKYIDEMYYQGAMQFMSDSRYKSLPQYLQSSGISSTFIAWKEALDKSRSARETAEKLKEESASRENVTKIA